MALGFTQIRIINIRTKLEKVIDIEDYSPIDLNLIVVFYENHNDYSLERI